MYNFLGSMLPQHMALCVSQFVCQKKFVCPFVGLHCGCVPPCVCPFIGRQSLLDPCMLPTLLCGIFRSDFYNVKNRICSLSYNLSSCLDIQQLDSQNCRG